MGDVEDDEKKPTESPLQGHHARSRPHYLHCGKAQGSHRSPGVRAPGSLSWERTDDRCGGELKRAPPPLGIILDRQMSSLVKSVLPGTTTRLPLKMSAVRHRSYQHGQRGLSELVAGKLIIWQCKNQSTGRLCSDGTNCL